MLNVKKTRQGILFSKERKKNKWKNGEGEKLKGKPEEKPKQFESGEGENSKSIFMQRRKIVFLFLFILSKSVIQLFRDLNNEKWQMNCNWLLLMKTYLGFYLLLSINLKKLSDGKLFEKIRGFSSQFMANPSWGLFFIKVFFVLVFPVQSVQKEENWWWFFIWKLSYFSSFPNNFSFPFCLVEISLSLFSLFFFFFLVLWFFTLMFYGCLSGERKSISYLISSFWGVFPIFLGNVVFELGISWINFVIILG